jgi:hypothetical protein
MYCDEPVSRWSGNALYGFNKRDASMEWLGRSFVVSGQEAGGRGPLLDILVSDEGAAGTVTRPIETLAHLMARPVLGRRSDGSFAVSMFDLDIGRARVRAARCRIALGTAAFPTATKGLPLALKVARCLRVEDARWRIAWPQAWPIDESTGESRSVTRRHGSSQGVTSPLDDATRVDLGGLHGTT